jgi:hypothetical protein
MDFAAQFVRRGGNDREAAHPFAAGRMPVFPQARKRHDAAIGERQRIGLFPARGFFPLVKVVGRYKATPALERFAEGRFVLDTLGLGVDIREAALDVLGPIGDQAPAQHIEAALFGLGVVADDRQGIGRRHVPARREVRRRALERDRKDELDLADVGRKADTATHGETITRTVGELRSPVSRVAALDCVALERL